MAWLKITIHHGPGHQSRTVKYVFLRWATKTAIEEAVEEEKDHGDRDYDSPLVDVKKVAVLPASEHESLVQHYHFQRDDAVAMLEILGKTKTSREYEWRCVKCGEKWTRFYEECIKPTCQGRVKRMVKKQEE